MPFTHFIKPKPVLYTLFSAQTAINAYVLWNGKRVSIKPAFSQSKEKYELLFALASTW